MKKPAQTKPARSKVFAVNEKNLDAHAKTMMHDPEKFRSPKSGADAAEDQGHMRRGKRGHYTYI
ncbi:MAG TPA: hypothetical protein VKB67_08800 [Rhizomicrobium sp.]|nr:hypothetical protein [Rhizomicrobium sp.]